MKEWKIIEGLTETIMELDPEGTIIRISPQVTGLLGFLPEEITGKNILELSCPDDRGDMEKVLKRVLKEDKVVDFEFSSRHNDGHYISVNSFMKIDESSNEPVIMVVIKGIWERTKPDEELPRSESIIRSTIDSMWDAIHVIDRDFRIILMNSTFRQWNEKFGLEKDAEGRDLFEIFPFLGEKVREEYEQVFRTGKPLFTVETTHPVDNDIVTETHKFPVEEDGHITSIVTVVRDITEHKKAERSLMESQERFRTLSEVTFEGILIHENGVVLDCNRSLLKMIGYTEEEVKGKNIIDLCVPELYRPIIMRNMKKNVIGPYEIMARRKDGTLFPVELEARDITDKGQKYRVVAIRDIIKRKRTEERLRRSEEKYRNLVETTNTGFLIVDENGFVIDANDEYVRMTGHRHLGEILGKNVMEWTAEHDLKRNEGEVRKCFEKGYIRDLEIDYVDENGGITPIEINATVIETEQGKVIMTLCRDITERRKAKEALKDSEEEYHTLIQTTSEGFLRIDPDMKILDVNDALCSMLGYERDEIIWKEMSELVFEKDLKYIIGQMERTESTGHSIFEMALKKKNGDDLFVSVNTTNLPEKNRMLQGSFAFVTDISQRKELMDRLTEINRDLVESREEALKLLEDLRRENMERILAENEREREKNRAKFYLDLLSHDIGNIHQGIFSWLQIADSRKEDIEVMRNAFKASKHLTLRSIDLVRNVKRLTRLQRSTKKLTPLDIRNVIENAIKGVKNGFPEKELDIRCHIPDEEVIVDSEPIIEELFLNLFQNGIKFQSGKKATLEIDINISEGGKIADIDIADHGPGIVDRLKPILFDRMKMGGSKEHSGLGLILVHELVNRYGGKIRIMDRIQGDHSKGARFIVTLPLSNHQN